MKGSLEAEKKKLQGDVSYWMSFSKINQVLRELSTCMNCYYPLFPAAVWLLPAHTLYLWRKSSLLLLQKILSQPRGSSDRPGGSLPSPPSKSLPPEPLKSSPTAPVAGKKQLKAKIITHISRNYSLEAPTQGPNSSQILRAKCPDQALCLFLGWLCTKKNIVR